MKIAVASGKGGTGKTTVAVSLALTIADTGKTVKLLDCDVEEPNCHLFLNPRFEKTITVTVPFPNIIESKCTACGICADVCEYNALAVIKEKVLVFPELCHGCGACSMFCPEDAIEETRREVGHVQEGLASNIYFAQGLLNIGELMTPAVIQAVKQTAQDTGIIIIDSPPGTSCPVIEAVKDADFVLLVTEPTPFGLNDLELAVCMVRQLGIPFGAVINRYDIGNEDVKFFCKREGIHIFMEIPDDRKIAETYSRGEILVRNLPQYEQLFEACWLKLENHFQSLNPETACRG